MKLHRFLFAGLFVSSCLALVSFAAPPSLPSPIGTWGWDVPILSVEMSLVIQERAGLLHGALRVEQPPVEGASMSDFGAYKSMRSIVPAKMAEFEISNVKFENELLTFTITKASFVETYEGKLSGKTIKGTITRTPTVPPAPNSRAAKTFANGPTTEKWSARRIK